MGPSPDGFYDLSFGDDTLTLTPGMLAGSPLGLRALDGNDTLEGSSDSEIVFGNQGDDVIWGKGGNDTIQGGKGIDVIFGDEGDDVLNGNIGQDFVVGGAGNDLIRGGKDADILRGESGNDTLIGDFGADMLVGGTESDLFVLRTDTVLTDSQSADFILDFDKFSDRIGLTGGLTEANLVLRQENLSIAQALNLLPGAAADSGITLPPEILNLLNPGYITQLISDYLGVNIDPDGDGNISGTSIEIGGTTNLGFVVNAAPTDVAGRFINVDF